MAEVLQPLKPFTEQEQVVYFYARGRRMSLADISKGLFRTRFIPLTPANLATAGFPSKNILYTVMAEITIDGAAAAGVIFEIGSTTHGAGITMDSGVLYMFAGSNGNAGVDITFTPAVGRRLWVALAMDPGNGRIGMYIDGRLQERKISVDTNFTTGEWADTGDGAVGQVNGTHNDRVPSVNTLSNVSMVSQVSFFSGQVPRGLLI